MGTNVTRKGQVTIPKPMRDRFGITPGAKVDFKEEAGKLVLAPMGVAEPRSRFDLDGPPPGWNGMTTDELMLLTRGHTLD